MGSFKENFNPCCILYMHFGLLETCKNRLTDQQTTYRAVIPAKKTKTTKTINLTWLWHYSFVALWNLFSEIKTVLNFLIGLENCLFEYKSNEFNRLVSKWNVIWNSVYKWHCQDSLVWIILSWNINLWLHWILELDFVLAMFVANNLQQS